MKKFLSLICALGITATSASNVVACGDTDADRVDVSELERKINQLIAEISKISVQSVADKKELQDLLSSTELTLNDKIIALEKRIADQEAKTKELEAQLNSTITTFNERIKKMENKVNQIDLDQLVTLQQDVDLLKKTLGDSNSGLVQKVKQLEDNLNNLKTTTIADLTTRIKKLEDNEFDPKAFVTMQTDIATLKGLVESDKTGNTALKSALDALRNDFENYKATATTQLEARVSALETLTKDLKVNTIVELQASIEAIKKTLDDKDNGLVQKINALQEQVTELTTKTVVDLSTRIKKLEDNKFDPTIFAAMQADIATLKGLAESDQTGNTALKSALDLLRSDFEIYKTTSISELETRISTLEALTKDLKVDTIGELQASIKAIKGTLDGDSGLVEKVKGLESSLDNLKTVTIADLSSRIKKLEDSEFDPKAFATMQTDIATLKGLVESDQTGNTILLQKLETLSASFEKYKIEVVNGLETRISTLEDKIQDLKIDDIKDLKTSLDTLKASIDSNNSALTTRVDELTTKLETLETTTIKSLQDDVKALKGQHFDPEKFNQMYQDLEEIKGLVKSTDTGNQALFNALNSLKTEFENYQITIANTLAKDIKDLQTKTDGLDVQAIKELQANFEVLKATVGDDNNGLVKNLKDLNASFVELKTKTIVDLQNRVEVLEKQDFDPVVFKAMQQSITELQTIVKANDSGNVALFNKLETLTQDFNDYKTNTVDKLAIRVEDLETKTEGLKVQDIIDLQHQLSVLNSQINDKDQLKDTVADLLVKFNDLDTKVTEDLDKRLSALEGQVEINKQDLQTIKDQISALEEFKNANPNLKDDIAELKEKVIHLEESKMNKVGAILYTDDGIAFDNTKVTDFAYYSSLHLKVGPIASAFMNPGDIEVTLPNNEGWKVDAIWDDDHRGFTIKNLTYTDSYPDFNEKIKFSISSDVYLDYEFTINLIANTNYDFKDKNGLLSRQNPQITISQKDGPYAIEFANLPDGYIIGGIDYGSDRPDVTVAWDGKAKKIMVIPNKVGKAKITINPLQGLAKRDITITIVA